MPRMGTNRQTEDKSLESAVKGREDKATGAPAPVIAKEDQPAPAPLVLEAPADDSTVGFKIAHPVSKSLVHTDADPDDKFTPGDEVKVPEHIAAHLAAIGAGRRV